MNDYLLHFNHLETKRAILLSEPPSGQRDSEIRVLELVLGYLKADALSTH